MFESSTKNWVVKSNDFVTARYDWTALQQRMVLMMIAQLDYDAEDFGNQKIQIAELIEKANLKGNSHYERAVEAAEVLLDQKIHVQQENGRWRGYNLLSYVEPGPGYVIARFNPDMRPFLLQLRRRFTKYMLEHAMRFQSPYSTRIYELLKQFDDIGYRTISIEQLRTILALEDKYPRFYDFKRRVLEQAKKEINKDTDVEFKYKVLRKGRSPIALRFTITGKKVSKSASSEKGQKRNPEPEEDPFEQYYDSLSRAEQDLLRRKAAAIADSNGTRQSSKWREAMIWKHMRRIWMEK